MSEEPKISFIIDCGDWRCGDDADDPAVFLGTGATQLLNRNGCMCCLGQIAQQCGVPIDSLLCQSSPCDLDGQWDKIPFLVTDGVYEAYRNSVLASSAMYINDNAEMTIHEKMERLTALFAEYDIELEFVDTEGIPKEKEQDEVD